MQSVSDINTAAKRIFEGSFKKPPPIIDEPREIQPDRQPRGACRYLDTGHRNDGRRRLVAEQWAGRHDMGGVGRSDVPCIPCLPELVPRPRVSHVATVEPHVHDALAQSLESQGGGIPWRQRSGLDGDFDRARQCARVPGRITQEITHPRESLAPHRCDPQSLNRHRQRQAICQDVECLLPELHRSCFG